jgi:hypothetical protein
MFLHCDGYSNSKQTNCSTYNSNGQLNFANRYSIREWDHNALDHKLLHKFVQEATVV